MFVSDFISAVFFSVSVRIFGAMIDLSIARLDINVDRKLLRFSNFDL